ncbi:NAD(P)/FAD-dependent oxidoreductase [Corynebacterium sp. 335C]
MTDATTTTTGSTAPDAAPDVDVLVVGAGPAGLTAATVLGRQMRRVLVVDAGAPRNRDAGESHMLLTRDGADPAEILRIGRAEASSYPGVEFRRGVVESIAGRAGRFTAVVSGREVTAALVLLAVGQADQVTGAPGLADLWGRGVYHCGYCHGFESAEQPIGVVAARAQDAVLARYLADRFSDDVVLFTGDIALDDAMRGMLDAGGVRVEDSPVARVSGAEPEIIVELDDGTRVPRARLFHRPDATQSTGLAAQLGCEMNDDWATVLVDPTQATSVPGVFAAGDCSQLRGLPAPAGFIATGSGDGQRAAVWIEGALFGASLGAGWPGESPAAPAE